MRHLSIDIETFSSIDIKKAGSYRYVQSQDFEILMIAYAWDNDPVQIIDLASNSEDPALSTIVNALQMPDVIKHAYNAAFEWYCLNKFWPSPIEQWRCTMAHGMHCGYTAGLARTCEAVGLPQEKKKKGIGMSLIRTFCVPQKPTKTNGNRLRTLPHHEPERWSLFKRYCMQDVEAERELERRLSPWPMPDKEQKLWELDVTMNARGVAVDDQLMNGALWCGETAQQELLEEARSISGLDNPNSRKMLLDWLNAALGDELDEALDNIRKDTVGDLLARGLQNQDAARLLALRQQFGKTSTKKYNAMQSAVCEDGRIRGLLQYYGANRTGRWAGRLVQIQNLPRNYLSTLDLARALVRGRRLDTIRLLYGNVPDTLSQLIRTAFVPTQGKTLLVADYSAIEARVIAWLAGEQWVNEVFATHGKIYEAAASQMFGVPVERIRKGNPEYALRQKGKVATLALGYAGGVNAMINMGALRMGLEEDELPDIVKRWRAANPNIVRMWYAIEQCAMEAVREYGQAGTHGLLFTREGNYETQQDFLTITLPSGRKLFYAKPFLAEGKFDRMAMHYWGVNQDNKKWMRIATFGGKLTENIIQAIARDCLAETLLRLQLEGFQAVFHVHDEVVIEGDSEDLPRVLAIMGEPIPWAPGLLLRGDGYTCDFYRKDWLLSFLHLLSSV